MKQREGGGDPGLGRQNVGLQGFRQVAAEACHEGGKEDEDQQPQEHRALVIAPDTGDLVDQRLQRMRVLPDVPDREVGGHIGEGQHRKGEGNEQEGDGCGSARQFDERPITAPHADERQHRLDERGRERQHQHIVSELDDH